MPYKDKEVRKEKNKEYQKKHYSKNKQYYKDKSVARKIVLREKIDEIKSKLYCIECGENDLSCLDFHHINKDNKEIEISTALSRGWSFNKILLEMEKCIILCANCHRKLHHNEKLIKNNSK